MRPVRRPVKRRFAIVSRLIVAVLLILGAGPLSAVTGPRLTNVTISQVYGGGGNTGATYTNDFVELHNPGINTVNLTGWAIQYASATGTTWGVSSLPSIVISPGGYILIQLASGGANGVPLPVADAMSALNMSGTSGKVVLTNTIMPLSGACPVGAQIQDFVGYGTANCFEGLAAAPAQSSTIAVRRNVDGCGDTNANNTDFSALNPAPRNTFSPPNFCEATVNETDVSAEADYCVLQFPTSFSVVTGMSTQDIFAQIFEAGATEMMGANGAITGQIGYGATGIDPSTQDGFTWFTAAFNTQIGNNDEYQASFIAPAAGTYAYGARFTLDGVNWTYCDANGAGSNPTLTFSAADLGVMTVTIASGAPGAPTGVAGVPGNQQVNVSWAAPADPGSSAITGYQVQVASGSAGGNYLNAFGCSTTTTATSCTAIGLMNGVPYFFKVAGINGSGTGAYSTASSAVTPATVPGAPTGVTATAGTGSASVSFVAPIDNGGAAITSYTATASPGGASMSGASSPLQVSGLSNSTAYTFTVTATNSAGTGPASGASNSVTPSPFTDDPVAAGGSIKRLHVAELRQAINAARQANMLAVFVFTDDPLVAGSTPIRALHITQLRLALQDVYDQRLMTRPTYATDPNLSTGTPIRAAHINELRSAVRAVQ